MTVYIWNLLLQTENETYELVAGPDVCGGKLKERKKSSKIGLRFDDDKNKNII